MKKILLIASTLAMTTMASLANSQEATPKAAPFGKTKSGTAVEMYTLSNGKLTAKVMTYGATLVELQAPDKDGKMADVVLGWDSVAGYESADNQYFGCTTGRVCNRIAKGKFSLDGKEYKLAINNEPNHLHGGVEKSLDKVVWSARPFTNRQGQGVEFSYTSPDGEEGYPGKVEVKVTYLLPNEVSNLRLNYTATTDKATPINLTNHSYFNLAGAGSPTILKHRLRILADNYTPADETLIPTGEIKSVEGTVLDLRKPTEIGAGIADLVKTAALGYDHNYVLNPPEAGREMRLAAVLSDPSSGRQMRVMTSQPGIQFYSGNFLKGQVGKGGKTYAHQSACCLETQHFPDSVNQSKFPSTILKLGDTFNSQTIYQFGLIPDASKNK